MYVLFREDIINSKDIAKIINEETPFRVETDLSKASKRDDVMSFKLSIPVKSLDSGISFGWENDELTEKCFSMAESLTKDLLEYFPKYTIQCSQAYKWDELEDRIHLVVVIANIDIKLKKLKLDILKRMMKQVD